MQGAGVLLPGLRGTILQGAQVAVGAARLGGQTLQCRHLGGSKALARNPTVDKLAMSSLSARARAPQPRHLGFCCGARLLSPARACLPVSQHNLGHRTFLSCSAWGLQCHFPGNLALKRCPHPTPHPATQARGKAGKQQQQQQQAQRTPMGPLWPLGSHPHPLPPRPAPHSEAAQNPPCQIQPIWCCHNQFQPNGSTNLCLELELGTLLGREKEGMQWRGETEGSECSERGLEGLTVCPKARN